MTGRFRVGRAENPREGSPRTDPPVTTPASSATAGRRILVVDDDPAIGSTLAECLGPAGYVIDISADGTDGVQRAVSGRPDLVVLDVHLPPTDGFDAAVRIRKSPHAKEIPILFVSGVRDLAVRMRRIGIEDADFLPKPFGVDELLTRIERVLETARVRQALHRQAERDELTGLGNLRLFQARLATEYARFARYGEPLTLVAVDVDKLKRINDEHGHAAGNEALRAIADVIGREARDVDIPARCGGDEFLIMLPHTTLSQAAAFAGRVVNAIRQITVSDVRLSVSVGIAELTRADVAATAEQLLRRADAAAYRAKREGGDRICLDGEADLT
jgi:diguanylate cyclase (GGDEF)-like protein